MINSTGVPARNSLVQNDRQAVCEVIPNQHLLAAHMHMIKGEVVNKVMIEIKIKTIKGDLLFLENFECLKVQFYIVVNSKIKTEHVPSGCTLLVR